MRLLVISDLHANGGALDAVAESVDGVILGDLVDYGPDPSAAVASGGTPCRAARVSPVPEPRWRATLRRGEIATRPTPVRPRG